MTVAIVEMEKTMMDDAVSTITRSGASGGLLADFRAIAEATTMDGGPKYAPQPVMTWLAKFVVGAAGGPNKDTGLYELCHLVNAVDACMPGSDQRSLLFLGMERATPEFFRGQFTEYLAINGWSRDGFEAVDGGIVIRYGDDDFTVRYGRMPFLAALYEFLSSMDNYVFFEEFGTVLDALVAGPDELRGIQDASNIIAGHLRQYRRRHLSRSQYDDRFDRIFSFLKDRMEDDRLSIDDTALLDFWLAYSTGDEYRGYKTVFDGFVTFMMSLEEVSREAALEQTAQIGLDRDLGEVEPEDTGNGWDVIGDWVSPLNVFDEGPAANIKFLKVEGERKPIEFLMNYGPYALRLPMAYLRLETFSPIQSGITVDLQVKRGQDSIQRRLNCEEAVSYQASQSNLTRVLGHVQTLQKAAFHAITREMRLAEAGGNVVALFGNQPADMMDALDDEDQLDADAVTEIAGQAEKAFRDLTRKGFEDEDLADGETVEGFKIGAGALLTIAGQLERMLKVIAALDAQKSNLESRFSDDLTVFKDQFHLIYGEAA